MNSRPGEMAQGPRETAQGPEAMRGGTSAPAAETETPQPQPRAPTLSPARTQQPAPGAGPHFLWMGGREFGGGRAEAANTFPQLGLGFVHQVPRDRMGALGDSLEGLVTSLELFQLQKQRRLGWRRSECPRGGDGRKPTQPQGETLGELSANAVQEREQLEKAQKPLTLAGDWDVIHGYQRFHNHPKCCRGVGTLYVGGVDRYRLSGKQPGSEQWEQLKLSNCASGSSLECRLHKCVPHSVLRHWEGE